MNTTQQSIETAKAAAKKALILAAAKSSWTRGELTAFGAAK